MEKILEVKQVSKRFGKVTVFHQVSLDLYQGEILAIVGENGAGKSTMMNILSGVYAAGEYEGEFYVRGKKCEFRSEHDAKEHGIEMVHQEISLHRDLSVAENLFLGVLPHQGPFIRWKEIYREAQKYLNMVNLDVDPYEDVRNLSNSQQQLLSIAKALVCKPEIILLDEPTSALTESDARNLNQIIKKLVSQGISCIYISHRLDEVLEIADRIAVLRDGEMISIRSRAESTVDQIIGDMIGRPLYEMYNKQSAKLGEVVFEVEGLTVPHPYILDKNIVENVGFNVRRGEILGLSGLVGAGRSESMCAVYGYMKKTSGKVKLEGQEIRIQKPRDAISQGIGMVSEDRKGSGIIAPMTLRENMTIASLKDISKAGFLQKKREVNLAQTFYDMLHVRAGGIEDYILNLSGGNQQKVVLSKWMMKDLKVLILDEPTRGVDVGAKIEIYNIVYRLAQKGVAIIFISSELNELLGVCDRMIVFGHGQIWGNIERDSFSQETVMKAATCVEKYGI